MVSSPIRCQECFLTMHSKGRSLWHNSLVLWILLTHIKFFRLHKSLWFQTGYSYLLHLGIHALSANPSLMIYHHYSSIFLLLLYVDDIILTSNDSSYLTSLIQNLGFIFELKDLSPFIPSLVSKPTILVVCLVINQNMSITFLFNITCLILNLAINPAFPPLT